jgi:hypothetical protein
MERINWNMVLLGGLLGGLIINIFEFVFNNILVKDEWAAAMRALGRPEQIGPGQITAFVVWGFLLGIFAIWLYSEIRPHYGAGLKTAVVAGVAVWFIGYLLAGVPPLVLEMFPRQLMIIGLAVGLLEIIVGTVAGAWLYRSVPAPGASTAAARL